MYEYIDSQLCLKFDIVGGFFGNTEMGRFSKQPTKIRSQTLTPLSPSNLLQQ